MNTRKPDPKTCIEAADRITEKYQGRYDINAREMREVAFTLKAFGDIPVPPLVIARYNWGAI